MEQSTRSGAPDRNQCPEVPLVICSSFFLVSKRVTNRFDLLAEHIGVQWNHPELSPGRFLPVGTLPLHFVVQRVLRPEGMDIENLVVDLRDPGRTDFRDRPPRDLRVLARHE